MKGGTIFVLQSCVLHFCLASCNFETVLVQVLLFFAAKKTIPLSLGRVLFFHFGVSSSVTKCVFTLVLTGKIYNTEKCGLSLSLYGLSKGTSTTITIKFPRDGTLRTIQYST